MARKPKSHPICDLTKTECQFGGTKNFNYGFMRGCHDFCRHPRENRPLYPLLSDKAIACPLGLLPAQPTNNETRG